MINPNDAPHGTGVVYFLMAGDNGHIKIGFTKNIKKRIENYRTHSSLSINVLGFFLASKRTESDLHVHFHNFRVTRTREWFHQSTELLAFIDLARAIEASGAIAINLGTHYGSSGGGIVPTARRTEHDRVRKNPKRAAQNCEVLVLERLGADASDAGWAIQNSKVRDPASKRRYSGELLTVSVAARMLDIPDRTMRSWCEKGLVNSTRTLGGMHRIPRSEIDRVRRGEPIMHAA